MTNTQYYYFTEQPYTGYDPAIQDEYPALRLTLPNSLYDAKLASELYNRYHDEYQVADEAGFDGIMINEQPREWMAPPGYATVNVAGIRRLRAISRSFDALAYEEAQKNYQLVVGTPDQVIEKLRYVRDLLGVGHLFLWSHDGYMSHEDTVRCIELMGKEVLPALREA